MGKIIFFITGLDSGGLENYLLRFLQYKATSFSEVVVCCKGGKGGQLEDDYLAIPNVKIIKNRISFFNPAHYIKLTSYLKKQNFDTICDFTGNFAGIILLCGSCAKISKRVVFYRGSSNHFRETILKLWYDNFVKKLTYVLASDILSNSQAAFDFFYKKEQQDSRFKVIYNGIDAAKFAFENSNLRQEFNIPEDAFVIGHTGRFNHAKNHDTISIVAEKLIKKYPDIYLILCGNGVRVGLNNKMKELEIDASVRLFDNRFDIPVFLNTMDAYFFPSITEGQPNALIEAMAVGLPFVASNIPPIKETVGNHTDLFDPLDVDGFYKALENLYHKKVKRDTYLKEKTIKEFNFEERFDEFYSKLLCVKQVE